MKKYFYHKIPPNKKRYPEIPGQPPKLDPQFIRRNRQREGSGLPKTLVESAYAASVWHFVIQVSYY